MAYPAARIFGKTLVSAGLILTGAGVCLGFVSASRLEFAENVHAGRINWGEGRSPEELLELRANVDSQCYQLFIGTLAAFLTGTTLIGFGWGLSRGKPRALPLATGASAPAARVATMTAILLAIALGGCGQGAHASTTADAQATPTHPLEDAQAKTLRRLKGRWQRALLEDVVFGDDGDLLVDGPGPFDLGGSYQLLDAKHITVNWGTGGSFTYTMGFHGDQLRLTLVDSSIGDGWTLTRRN